MRIKGILVIIFLGLLLISSCGKKGDPTLKFFEKPSPVDVIKAVHREGEIKILWEYPLSERQRIKGFHIFRAEGNSQDFKNIAFVENTERRYIDRDFKIRTDYYYRIKVESLKGIFSDDSTVLRVRPEKLPDPPSKLSYRISNDAIEITWEPVKNQNNDSMTILYNIYKGFEKGKASDTPINDIPLKETIFKDTINQERTVYYLVRSLLNTEIMDEGHPSEELAVDTSDFIPSKPTGIRFVIFEKGVYLLWEENPETWVKKYRIYRKRETDSEFKIIGESVVPAFTDMEALREHSVYYITAFGPQKEGIRSDPIDVYPITDR